MKIKKYLRKLLMMMIKKVMIKILI